MGTGRQTLVLSASKSCQLTTGHRGGGGVEPNLPKTTRSEVRPSQHPLQYCAELATCDKLYAVCASTAMGLRDGLTESQRPGASVTTSRTPGFKLDQTFKLIESRNKNVTRNTVRLGDWDVHRRKREQVEETVWGVELKGVISRLN
ncbi:hypothetical protein RRG08_020016 [Elysia crispata]|uniref:Uncharacterized protein n=1 Tax=Elysia crispata TaxID=231223 RepID=A0AAE1BBR2_9GAST|nr:hypothetical protein RRG08_020016 [Elysia crispata]